jgi:DNA-binding CsgD family transcriptional regulator
MHSATRVHDLARCARRRSKLRPGSRYFPYCTRPWIDEAHFDAMRDEHLTGAKRGRSSRLGAAPTAQSTTRTCSTSADLYAQGRTLRQIGAELGVTATTVSQQLRRAGVTRASRRSFRSSGFYTADPGAA